MVRSLILSVCVLSFIMPAFADSMTNQDALNYINQNPNFGGRTEVPRAKYPSLIKPLSVTDMIGEEAENEMNAESGEVKFNPNDAKRTPMNYSNFPQNYDSSNSMMRMQGGMQNMFMQ